MMATINFRNCVRSLENCNLISTVVKLKSTTMLLLRRVFASSAILVRDIQMSRPRSIVILSNPKFDCGRLVSSPVASLVDVDRRRRIVGCSKCRRQLRTVELIAGRGHHFARELAVAALVGIRPMYRPGGRIVLSTSTIHLVMYLAQRTATSSRGFDRRRPRSPVTLNGSRGWRRRCVYVFLFGSSQVRTFSPSRRVTSPSSGPCARPTCASRRIRSTMCG